MIKDAVRPLPCPAIHNGLWLQAERTLAGRRRLCTSGRRQRIGIPIADSDARHLIATLLADGSPDARTAAGQITKAVDRELSAVGLTRKERAAVLACLKDPPAWLAELRGALMRDHSL